MDRLCLEVCLLRTLENENIITSFSSWTDHKHKTLNFITKVCTSGNLREYRRKHLHVSIKALKKWFKQILRGLEYLHSHEPCIGLAAKVGKSHMAHSMLGTLEFMALELDDENYTEMVDIYAFGMCVLELVTLEIPYSECDSVAKIYKKMSSGVKSWALNKVKDSEVKGFIEKCLAPESERSSASELLNEPFFDGLDDAEIGINLLAFSLVQFMHCK